MSKAEEYSFNIPSKLFQQLTKEQQVLWRKEIESAFNNGYHHAEKDLELTWEDIPEIFRISEQLKISWWFRDNEQTKQIGTKVFWEEVLKRFKEKKGKNYDNCKDKER